MKHRVLFQIQFSQEPENNSFVRKPTASHISLYLEAFMLLFWQLEFPKLPKNQVCVESCVLPLVDHLAL